MHAVKTYDVIIIGAGPAGIFTALELADKGFKILMVEKGQDIRERIATSLNQKALPKDRMRNVVCGWGGAGAFSDGKLTLTTEYGGNLDDYMSKADLMDKIRYGGRPSGNPESGKQRPHPRHQAQSYRSGPAFHPGPYPPSRDRRQRSDPD